MERYKEAREKALKNLKIADHMLNITFPIVKDPRLLLSIMDNIFLSLTHSMAAILHFEHYNKRISAFNDTFESKFNLFKTQCVDRLRINRGYAGFVQDVKNTVLAHKKSPVEFVRNGSLIICSDNYQMQKINITLLKTYLDKTRSFVYIMNNLVK